MDVGRLIRETFATSRFGGPIFSFTRNDGLLSLVIGDRCLWAAQVQRQTETAPLARGEEFVYPADCGLEQPDRLGAELGSFLRKNGFSARQAVVGVPAKWLIVRPYDMPPADDETASSVLWLHTTEQITPALGPMIFDYLGESCPSERRSLLLVGLQKQWMDRLSMMAQSAGFKLAGITPIATVVGATTARHVRSSLIALFGPGGLELIDQDGRQTRSMRYVRSNGSPQPAAADFRSVAAAMSLHIAPAERSHKTLVLWDEMGLEPRLVNDLKNSADLSCTEVQRQWIDAAESDKPACTRGLSALALNQQAARGLSVDFLHPRLAPPRSLRPRWFTKSLAWAAAVAVLIFLAAIFDLVSIQRQAWRMDDQLQAMEPALDLARPYVANMQFADSFRSDRPRYLACVADLTRALPPDGQTYLTGFSLQSGMGGQMSGVSASEENVLGFRDRLASGGRFSDLTCRLDAREARGGDNSVLFTITFVYKPSK